MYLLQPQTLVEKANSPTEIIDLVNIEDRVIGTIRKKYVIGNPHFIHRSVSAFIYNQNKELLLQFRSRYKKVKPAIWSRSVAGHVPAGINPEEAIKIECSEELGLSCKFTFVKKEIVSSKQETQIAYRYIAKLPDNQLISHNDYEIEKVMFIDYKKLLTMRDVITENSFKSALETFEYINSQDL